MRIMEFDMPYYKTAKTQNMAWYILFAGTD